MGKRTSIAVAGGGLLLGAALFWHAAERAGPAHADLEAMGTELEMRVREAAAGARARAVTLAELPRLQLAVATDAATVRDLTSEELAFRPKAGETIEIGQLPRGRGPVSLILLPPGSTFRAPLERAGSWLVPLSGQMAVCVVASVQPRARSDEVGGAVAVTWPVDTRAVAARLDQLGVAARIEMSGGTVALSTRPLLDSGPKFAFSLGNESIGSAKLVVPGRTGSRVEQVAGCLLALAALIAGAVLAWRPGRAATDTAAAEGLLRPAVAAVAAVSAVPEPPRPGAVPETLPEEVTPGSFDSAVTPIIQVDLDLIKNTLALTGSAPASAPAVPTAMARPAPRATTPDRADFPVHEASDPSGAVSQEPLAVVVHSQAARSLPDPLVVARYQAVFREFLELRRFCDEAVDISFESFLGRLTAARVQLLQRGAYQDVTFDVFINGEGKAAVRAIGRMR